MTEPRRVPLSDAAPILISATSDAAIARAVRTAEAAGCRIGGAMMLTSICDRIEHQIKASAVWVELDRDGGAEMDEVLDCISGNAADGRFCAVVSTTPELIDAVAARVESAAVELIVNADEAQRLAALALAAARSSMCERVMDIAADQSAERLRQLGDEVSRIAATLARLSSGPTAGLQSASPVSSGSAPEVSAESCAE